MDGRLCNFNAVSLPQVSIDFLNISIAQNVIFPFITSIPSVGWTDAISVVPKGLQCVVTDGGVAGDGLQDPDLRRPHVIRKVFVMRRRPGKKDFTSIISIRFITSRTL